MPEGEGDKERSGPVLRIAALLVAVLALATVIAPRLASSSAERTPARSVAPPASVEPTEAGAEDAAASMLSSTSSAPGVPAPAEAAAIPATGPTETGRMAGTTVPVQAGETVTEAEGGAVTLALAGLHAGREGPRRTGFFADDRIGWHFRVVNTGTEYLWGLFVYLERYGPVACSVRRLDVGETADCWAETWAEAGTNTAEAWVTAWTTSRMVSSRISHRVVVAVS